MPRAGVPPPPIQGIGNAGGFTMQVQLRDGSFDFSKLQAITNAIVDAQSPGEIAARADLVPRRRAAVRVEVDRVKAQTLLVGSMRCSRRSRRYLGSSYVAQFNKFGRTFQVYVQADSQFRLRPEDITELSVRSSKGDMVPIGTLAAVVQTTGPSLITLYNLYPARPSSVCRRRVSRRARRWR